MTTATIQADISDTPGAVTDHFLTCQVAGRQLALAASEVFEVLQAAALSPLAQGNSLAEGTLNVRGEVVVVFDLRRLLGVEKRPWTRQTRIVVGQGPTAKVGLVVDGVAGVLEMLSSQLLPPPPDVLGLDARAIVSVLPQGELLVPVLSVAKLLDRLAAD